MMLGVFDNIIMTGIFIALKNHKNAKTIKTGKINYKSIYYNYFFI